RSAGTRAQFVLWLSISAIAMLAAWMALRVVRVAPDFAVDRRVPPARARVLWACIGAVGVALSLGLTTFVTADIAAVPLLWTVPLCLYVLALAMAFAGLGQSRLALTYAVGQGAALALWFVLPSAIAA